MTSDGGAVAAYGFRRQYLVTAEEILRLITCPEMELHQLAVIIEPTRIDLPSTEVIDDDVVDFAIELSGEIVRRVQVKSSRVPSGMNPLKYSDAAAIFKRLGTGVHKAEILTNKPLAKKLAKACAAPTGSDDGGQVYSVTGQSITSGETTPARRIVRDDRTIEAVKQSVLALVRQIRRDNATGLGEQSAALLAAMLLDTMFEAAADLTARRWTADDIVAMLCLPDSQIAHARRRFDWGVPLIEVPRLASAVARTNDLATLTNLFHESVAGRAPTVTVLSGTTGFGKSTIAADFCHLSRHFYEHVCWIDARSPGLIEARVKDLVTQMGVEIDPDANIGALFRTEMASIGGPFVVVFDGARHRQDIEPFLPTSGCGFVIVTTTNSTGWWHTARQLPIGVFSDGEAIACFEAYAGIEPGMRTDAVADVVGRLKNVPLAIAMAASYFRNADEDVAQLSGTYFKDLDALDDATAVPEGFDKTAFAAVRFAVKQIGSGTDADGDLRRETQLLLYHSAYFAPELIPVNMVLQTVESSVATLDLTHPPSPAQADRHVRNQILTNLRTQTIARRRSYSDPAGATNPASDTITIHPLVHEILREIHLRAAPRDGSVINLLTLFMGHLYGWLIELRRSGAFFPVEQLLAHAEWILDFADTIAIPAEAEAHDIYVFRCATFYLRYEVANCYSSRGDYEHGVALIEQALDDFAGVTPTIQPQCALAKAICDAIADAHTGGLGEQRALGFARRAIEEIAKIEGFTEVPRRGEIVYQFAAQAAQAINLFSTPETRAVAELLAEIATRQQLSAPQEIDKINQIHRFLKAGQYQQGLALTRETRGTNPSAYQQIMFDNFEIIANLNLHRFDAAADGIDRILAAAAESPHMRAHAELACVEIGQALQATASAWSGRSPRLTTQTEEIRGLSQHLAQ
ncbi:ATP-binding protein [Mycobacteroides abscessus]|uniref:ATP-binding protein n=1 Tax=Mycobacteroides abscessus TaxID=36809 RepID=UPI000C25C15B|nr:ATP-binding protein [Mycobacteroides abscessus]RIR15177.1 ATP-binding protein [Mycobacteroides abscessus]RIS07876.1 ATP-binding protein [Mycobacteroides abscessus]